ncbi:MAG: DegV family protein [Acidimicrobiales bacterium]
MAGVRIVTDSASDLDADLCDEFGIAVVPLTIRFGGDEFVDREELSVDEFYRRLAESPTLPETAAPAPGAFEKAYRRLAEDGADAIVCITLSSDVSATMQSAMNAAEAVADDIDVRVVDSRGVTVSEGNKALAAARAAKDGKTADDIVALVADLAARTRTYGTLDTLDNLKKGGRIGNAQALLGTLLSIKPLIDISSGKVEEAGRTRTRRKALEALAGKVLEHPAVEDLAVMHGQAPDLDAFLALLAPRYSKDDLRIALVGPVVGAHAGPRVIGVTFHLPK